MRVPKSSTLFLLLMILLSVMQGSSSTSRLISHATHVDSARSSERKLFSSMFIQSYSAILSSLNSRKSKSNQIHAVSHRVVPSGPNPLHN